MAGTTLPPDTVDSLELKKVEAEKATEVLERYEPSEAATGLVKEDMTPGRLLEYLLHEGLMEDSLSLMAYGLPRREAVWWASQCVEIVTPEDADAAATDAIAAAKLWLEDPSDENRRAAMVAADAATYETPAGCLALSVFFTEGSMAPADCPDVPVGEGFCARTVFATVHMCSLVCGPDPADMEKAARDYVALGIQVANEPAPWDDEEATA